jgi:hypothetical protein
MCAYVLTRIWSHSAQRGTPEPWLEAALDGGASSVVRPPISSPTRKLVTHSAATTTFPDIGLARGAFFSVSDCLSVSAFGNAHETSLPEEKSHRNA